jgi:eukaryotic-like serine/threonine-protein kinase
MQSLNSNPTRPATLVEGLELLGASAELLPGMRLGPYRLVKPLGQGGMGVVWLADQLEPFERQVAIKLSTTRVGAGLAQAYFEVERQALAQLVHPYIAQIYDAGTLPGGAPYDNALYFAMEYVAGDTLDTFVSTQKPTLDACADLLGKVCQGVHYAHQRGLIHRDLKPTNVLIAQLAGAPIPKIIDFGIAIGVDSARAAGAGAGAGTRAYMAPEQLTRGPAGIDLRADVYALGAMLVETLCLSLGMPIEAIHRSSFRSLLSNVTPEDGAPPQAHVTPALDNAATLELKPASAFDHKTLRAQLKRIPESLRAIALKALAQDRTQRYESAAALADDLVRWRERRPVLARRGGRVYAIRCFINRYRLASALAGVTMVALVAGLVVATYGLKEAQRAKALAETRREQAEGLVSYMLGDFAAKLADVGKLDLIDGVANRALQYLTNANIGDATSELHRATALRTIGDVQTQRGQWPQARATFALAKTALENAEKATHGPVGADLLFEQAQIAYWIGYCDYNSRDFKIAKIQWQQYLILAERLQPLTKESGLGLVETSYALSNLGTLAYENNDLASAERDFDRVVVLSRSLAMRDPKNEDLAVSLADSISWVAKIQEARGEFSSARASYLNQVAVCESMRASVNSTSWRFAIANANQWIGLIAYKTGELIEAETRQRAAISELSLLHKLEPEQSEWARALATSRSDLGAVLIAKKEFNDADHQLNLASEIFDVKTNKENASSEWLRGAAVVKTRHALLALKQNRAISAKLFLEGSVSLLTKATGRNQNDRKSGNVLAAALVRLAELPENDGAAEILLVDRAMALVSGLSTRADTDVIDTLVRAHTLRGNFREVNALKLHLNTIRYRNPEYLDFLTLHQGAVQ